MSTSGSSIEGLAEQVAELCPKVFMEGWFACLTEFGIPEDNPAWAKATPTLELPAPPAPYLPMILLGFNKEEYMNHSDEDEEVVDAAVASGNKVSKLAEEAGKKPRKKLGKKLRSMLGKM